MSQIPNERFHSRHGYVETRSRSAPYLLLLAVGVLLTIVSLIGMSYGEAWHPHASAKQETPPAEVVSLAVAPVTSAKLVETPVVHPPQATPPAHARR